MKKRFLSLLLVLVLIMSLMPAALAVNADDAQPKTISVTFRLHTDTDEWIAPTEVSDLPEGTSVFTVFQKVLADKGYTYEYHEQYCYVQAITAPDARGWPSLARVRIPAGCFASTMTLQTSA